MISPELLRKNPFFGSLSDAELRAIAMITEEETIEGGVTLFKMGEPADALFFLHEGRVELYYPTPGSDAPGIDEGILVADINVGEPFSISSLIEPYILSTNAYVPSPSRVIKIDAIKLRSLFEKDRHMAYQLTYQAAKVAAERLNATRVELAANWV